ncbi:LysR family transcriptional regulator [Hydromonas duriensis]|uniref:LysR family transcriptional regulator n=1 Tax=Hydromonas duriensis TaxID=1527608 RepID=A0A4R6Y7I5_9BURK|nr:LysR family transcriptional regulator [Hydromonas duriensis]TDR31288.1 LysR family transcriptional regulator [Hydromonas duriensis]
MAQGISHPSKQVSLDNLQLFIAVADAGGFSRAAERLDLPVATLSRRIASLEKGLNVPLFKRNTRHVSLTPAGEAFYQQLVPAMDAVQASVNEVTDAASSIQGVIRIATTADFARLNLAQPLTQFVQKHPNIRIELHLSSNRVDLVKEQIDVAIRMGDLSDSNLYAWPLLQMPSKLYATPSYLAGLPPMRHPNDLKQCNFLVLRTNTQRQQLMLQREQELIDLRIEGNLQANDMGVIISLCAANAGVAMIPELLVHKEILNDVFVPVLPDWHSPAIPIHALTTARNPPARIKHLIDFLKAEFAELAKKCAKHQ